REVGVAGTAIDVAPRRGMDDDFRRVTIEQGSNPVRLVEVEGAAVPGDRPGRAAERGVGERRHERPAETTGCSGHRDAHQAPGTTGPASGVAIAAAAWPFARRRAYWRSYQPSQSPDLVAR